jgi:peptidoglycan L-alanyl-D-glutamate endopeptidase CwlK
MNFKLSQRSLNNLQGVDERLQRIVKRAITLTKVDFAVIEGLRSADRQLELFYKGASNVKEGGKHQEGLAVDLMAFLGNRGSWELALYDEIADAMRVAAIEEGAPLRWGAAWNVPDIRVWNGSMESAMNHYVDERRKAGKRPFIDAPHFELV